MRHHAIVVTSWDHERTTKLRDEILAIADQHRREPLDGPCTILVSEVVGSLTNGYSSFFIGPDGSKEGWDTSNLGDEFREAVIEYLRNAHADGLYSDWAEVRFGDEDRHDMLLRSSKGHDEGTSDAD